MLNSYYIFICAAHLQFLNKIFQFYFNCPSSLGKGQTLLKIQKTSLFKSTAFCSLAAPEHSPLLSPGSGKLKCKGQIKKIKILKFSSIFGWFRVSARLIGAKIWTAGSHHQSNQSSNDSQLLYFHSWSWHLYGKYVLLPLFGIVEYQKQHSYRILFTSHLLHVTRVSFKCDTYELV